MAPSDWLGVALACGVLGLFLAALVAWLDREARAAKAEWRRREEEGEEYP